MIRDELFFWSVNREQNISAPTPSLHHHHHHHPQPPPTCETLKPSFNDNCNILAIKCEKQNLRKSLQLELLQVNLFVRFEYTAN